MNSLIHASKKKHEENKKALHKKNVGIKMGPTATTKVGTRYLAPPPFCFVCVSPLAHAAAAKDLSDVSYARNFPPPPPPPPSPRRFPSFAASLCRILLLRSCAFRRGRGEQTNLRV